MFRSKTTNSSTSSSSINPSDPETRFTLPHLRNLHKTLTENKFVNTENENLVVEVLRALAEMVLYGDNKSELLFDFFCEKNMLALFLEIMRSPTGCPVKVHVQILQTLSILCQCVKNNTSLYYLLSNNHVNDIIRYPYNFEIDEISDIFISFMKSLSLRLNEQTIQFFFIEESQSFPILSKAIEFLKFRDPMVRTGAQSTILNIFRINEPKARQYSLNEDIMIDFATEIVDQLEGHYNQIQSLSLEYYMYSLQPKMKDFTEGKMGNRIEYQIQSSLSGIEDWLYYLQDIFGLQLPSLSNTIIKYFLLNYVTKLLLLPLLNLYSNKDNTFQDLSQTKSQESNSSSSSSNNNNNNNNNSGNSGNNSNTTNNNNGDQTVNLMISLFLLIQLMNTIKDKKVKRALTIQLFHPLSSLKRKSILESDIEIQLSDIQLQHDDQIINEKNQTTNNNINDINDLNPYRLVLIHILKTGPDRLVLLVTLLIESTIRSDINSCNCFLSNIFENKYDDEGNIINSNENQYEEGILATSSMLEPLILTHIWDPILDLVDLNPNNFINPSPISRSQSRNISNQNLTLNGSDSHNNLLKDIEAEAEDQDQDEVNSPISSESPSNINLKNEIKKDYKAEMNEYAYGCEKHDPIATRGRGGSEDLYDNYLKQSDDIIEDIISVKALVNLEKYCPTCKSIETSNNNIISLSLIETLLNIILTAHKHPLATLQITSVILYDLIRMDYHSNKLTSTESYKPLKILHCLQTVRTSLKQAANLLLLRSHGWLVDTLLVQVEDEIRRASSSKPLWEATIRGMSSDVLLMLPPTTYLFLRLGNEHSVSNSEVEKLRREIQIFMLLRSLYKCLLRLVNSSTLFTTGEDIGKELLDQTLSEFSEFSGLTSTLKVGEIISMSGRHCFPATIISPILDLTEFAKSGKIISSSNEGNNSTTSSPNNNNNNRRSSLSPVNSFSSINRRTSFGSLVSDTKSNSFKLTPERNYKIGEVYFIYDEIDTFLLTVPIKRLDSGSILLSIPMNRVDGVADSENDKYLKILLRSSVPIPTMMKISNDTHSSHSSVSSMYDGPKIKNILPPRTVCTGYQIIIGFDTVKHCEMAVKHIQTCKLRVKSLRLESFRMLLQKWSTIESDSLENLSPSSPTSINNDTNNNINNTASNNNTNNNDINNNPSETTPSTITSDSIPSI